MNKNVLYSMLGVAALISAQLVGQPNAAFAGSLAGDAGDERRKIAFPPHGKKTCKKGFDKYVAASGHSAYAATPSGWGIGYFICAWTTNAGSKSAAEKQALKTCNAGLEKYKMRVVRLCEIVASK